MGTEKSKLGSGIKYHTYILKDKQRGIIFKASSGVKMDRHIPLYVKQLWDDYPLDLMRHYRAEVLHLADKYGIYLIPPLAEDPVYDENYSPVWPADSVFINSPEQLDRVVDLYFALARHTKNIYGNNSMRSKADWKIGRKIPMTAPLSRLF